MYLFITLFTGEDGQLVATGAVLGNNLITAGERSVVEEAIEGGDRLRADQADAYLTQSKL